MGFEDLGALNTGWEEGQIRLDRKLQRLIVVDYEDQCNRTGTWISVVDLLDRTIHYSVRPEALGPVLNEMEVIAWAASQI